MPEPKETPTDHAWRNKARDAAERYIDKAEPGECWLWNGNLDKNGYGVIAIRHNGKTHHWFGHRLAYLAHNGELPPKLYILHSCDNPTCCNHAHLRAGTPQDNMDDMKSRGRGRGRNSDRTHCHRGHEFTHENTVWRPQKSKGKSQRWCRICRTANRTAHNRRLQRRAHAAKAEEHARKAFDKRLRSLETIANHA